MNPVDDAMRRIFAGHATADDVEGQRLDFKRETPSAKDTHQDIADAAACFANASGGTVIIGVADRVAGPAAFLGTQVDTSVLRRRIFEITDPGLDVQVTDFSFEGIRLVRVDVQEGLDVYTAGQKKAPTRRHEDRCLPMSTVDISRLHDERRGTDWSATESERSVSDSDPTAVTALRALMRRASNPTLQALADSDLDEALRALGLASRDRQLTKAGELLLCQERDQAHEVLVYQYRDTMGGETKFSRRWNPPLLPAFSESLAVVEARIDSTPVNLPSGQQIQIQDYPVAAIREAVSNAMMHGDHRDRRPVHVEHSPESLEVRSPGRLVAGVSPSNILTHPPKPRFPALAEALRALGLAEKFGQGVDRMYREAIRNGRSTPTFEETEGDGSETIVRFLGGPPNTRIAKFVSTLPESAQDDTNALLVVSILTNQRSIDARKLAPIAQRDAAAAQAILLRLATDEIGLIEPTSRTASRAFPDYRLRAGAIAALGPALSYQTRSRSDRDKKILDHVREYDSINNATIQRLFDVDVYTARDILQELVGREVLVRTSVQTRGTAVRYGRGPHFPAVRRRSSRNTKTDDAGSDQLF
ncbi:ATP-dependent DNA helicase RecG [Rathayibacter sp. PhB127]|uniref:RNA-binding domain-containing protein n=1 Tax=Rathayibacter sp. PhB127 TaxID=2485176 RepID=UPI000F9FF78E|nr:ATP-binding protein [Rathayibacter sp. PhB127]ROS28702.1 ATP-dependent DNA helicase RecG [Rathayibacter sp. PhB127]